MSTRQPTQQESSHVGPIQRNLSAYSGRSSLVRINFPLGRKPLHLCSPANVIEPRMPQTLKVYKGTIRGRSSETVNNSASLSRSRPLTSPRKKGFFIKGKETGFFEPSGSFIGTSRTPSRVFRHRSTRDR